MTSARSGFIVALCMISLSLWALPATAQLGPLAILRILAAGAAGDSDPPLGNRSDRQEKLARGLEFNSVPRTSGTQFIVVTNAVLFLDSWDSIGEKDLTVPVLFGSDPVARIPESISKHIRGSCQSGWAIVEFQSDNTEAEQTFETFGIDCGVNSDSMTGSNIKTSFTRAGDKPGDYRGKTKTFEYGYLEAELRSFEVVNQGAILATVRLRNSSDIERPLMVAYKAVNSEGLPDYWKFHPRLRAALSDNSGNSFGVRSASGIPWRKSKDDYVTLWNGEDTLIQLDFSSGGELVGNSFDLAFEVWLVSFASGKKNWGLDPVRIRLSDIRPFKK